MPEQAPDVRNRNFKEVPLGLTPEMAMTEASRCLQCKKPACVEGCPVSVDIPGFIHKIAEGDFAGAAARLWEKNALPAVCGRVCPQKFSVRGTVSWVKKEIPLPSAILKDLLLIVPGKAAVQSFQVAEKTGKKVAV